MKPLTMARSSYLQGSEALERQAHEGAAQTPFARSRLLKWLGAGVFTMAVDVFLPRSAAAHAPPDDEHPCFGFDLCNPWVQQVCCDDVNDRCSSSCTGQTWGCPSGGLCWATCHQGVKYRCCDCTAAGGSPCICRFNRGTC